MKEDFTIENGSCHITKKAVNHNPKHMLPVVDWLSDVPHTGEEGDLVEVQFKNTRKGYYHNSNNLPLEKGVKVVVEANPGTDLGEVVLIGRLVPVQIKKNHINLLNNSSCRSGVWAQLSWVLWLSQHLSQGFS